MGRAERRKLERKNRIENKKGKVSLSYADIAKIKRDTSYTTSGNNVEHFMTILAYTLYKDCNFDDEQILSCLNKMDDYSEAVLNDELSMDDMVETLDKELGIRIVCQE